MDYDTSSLSQPTCACTRCRLPYEPGPQYDDDWLVVGPDGELVCPSCATPQEILDDLAEAAS
jgi:hypothetical protein